METERTGYFISEEETTQILRPGFLYSKAHKKRSLNGKKYMIFSYKVVYYKARNVLRG